MAKKVKCNRRARDRAHDKGLGTFSAYLKGCPEKRGLGYTAAVHKEAAAERDESARRLYANATKYARNGNCSAAVTSLVLAASYEGEVQAHNESGGTGGKSPALRRLMTQRDKTMNFVIKSCTRSK